VKRVAAGLIGDDRVEPKSGLEIGTPPRRASSQRNRF
jgi:hypothetical protein